MASQKAYVLDAPLGDPPALVESLDVMNAWQARSDDYSIVQCAMLYGLERDFKDILNVMEHMRCSWN